MSRHLTPMELDQLMKWKGKKTPKELHALLAGQRLEKGIEPVKLPSVRKALRGQTHLRGRSETRGRKRRVTARGVEALDNARKRLQEKCGGNKEVPWKKIIKAARIKVVHPTTAARRMDAAGKDIKFRRPREKPQRTAEDRASRAAQCKRMRRLPEDYFIENVDLIIDNKQWPIPTSKAGRDHLAKMKVRGHLRTRREGLKPQYTKPNAKKHRRNVGGSVKLCAGMSRDRVVMWTYLPDRWCGKAAVDLYDGPIKRTLKRVCGEKRKYVILEDNDPTGYKSNAAIAKKKELGISPIEFPIYSPDLNPCDYFLWRNIEARMDACAPKGKESKEVFMARLKRVALATDRSVVRNKLKEMKKRIAAIVDESGGNISID